MAKNVFRATSIFKIIIRICMKNVEFSRKTSKFLPKRCLLIFCVFFLNEKELNQQVCLIKYVEISNPYLTKKKETKKRERERSKNIIQLQKKNSKAPEKFSLFTLVTTHHKLSLLPLVVRHWRKFEKQKLVLLQMRYVK